jgi:hypothetical protein
MTGHLYTTVRTPSEADADADVEVEEHELEKLRGFEAGTPVVVEAIVVAAPEDGRLPTSYIAFDVGGVNCGLTTITHPPPQRDTTVVFVRVGQRISLRITQLAGA